MKGSELRKREVTCSTQMILREAVAFLAGCCILYSLSCGSPQPQHRADPDYIVAIQQWHRQRIERLKSPDGWLNLAGLYWLKEGENTVGAGRSNDIVFPENKAPDLIGTFTLQRGTVSFRPRPGVEVMHSDTAVTDMKLRNDTEGNPTVLTLGRLSWYIIKRGEKFGVRLRDLDAPLVKAFKGIDMFPIDSAWCVEATFDPYEPPKTIAIPTVLNTIVKEPSPGALVFTIAGKTFRLDTIGERTNEELFVIFSDPTNGQETYGAGRFLYVPPPGKDGRTRIDFNKAYNPPCAFTMYATCPLPPEQNHLPIRVTAGEKKYAHSNH